MPAQAATGVAIADADAWLSLVGSVRLGGPVRELAAHAVFLGFDDGVLRLGLSPVDDHLRMPALVDQLAQALAPALGGSPRITFETAEAAGGETLHQRDVRQRDARQAEAEAAFASDPGIQRLVGRHGARIVPDSIRPIDTRSAD